ncbi:beta strand repeat-containing protein [Oceanobacter mangrovi]|uniref:beta strand repeat-containing protein n=1 Tax=Oceanobacter mangrovi TaxID=2862510 RepID=UPI001C8EFBE9|nr:Ig-like domain-containing protein [Oceanobacter mangrovi]
MTMNWFVKNIAAARMVGLALVSLLALAGCGGGGSGSSGGSSGYALQVVDYQHDYETAGGDFRLSELLSMAMVETSTGVQDNCLYLSSDKQSYISAPYSWTVSATGIVSLDTDSACVVNVTATGVGTVTITATNDYQTASRTLTVDPALLTSISIAPTEASVYKGLTQNFSATGHYSDSTSVDLTDNVSWAASDTSLASFSNSTAGLLTANNVGDLTASASFANDLSETVSTSVPVAVTAAAVTAIAIDSSLALPLGRVQALTATATFTDSSTDDLANDVTWVVADTSIASIDSDGNLTAQAEGETTLYAVRDNNYGTAISSNVMTLTVESKLLDSITISPVSSDIDATSPMIGLGRSEAFYVIGTYSNGDLEDFSGSSSATLASSDTSVATFTHSGSTALVATLVEGTTLLTASVVNRRDEVVVGSLSLQVNKPTLQSIVISSPASSIIKGDQETLTATGYYDDDTSRDISSDADIVWSSSNTNRLAFNEGSSSPVVDAEGVGSASVTASMENEQGTLITSNSVAITVTPAVVRSVRIDSATDGELTDSRVAIPQGLTHTLVLTGIYSDETEQTLSSVDWVSAAATYATVSSAGVVTATKTSGVLGDVVIAAAVTADGDDFNAQITVEVTDPILTSLTVALGTEQSGFWKGRQQAFVATGDFSNDETRDLTDSVSWTLRDDDLNRVTQQSDAYILQLDEEGEVQFSATYTDAANDNETTTDTYTFTVKPALLDSIVVEALNQYGLSVTDVPSGRQQQFYATGIYSDNSEQDLTESVTWVSSMPTYLSIVANGSSGGLADALQPTSDSDSLVVTASLTNADSESISGELAFEVAGAAMESIYLQLPSTNVYGGLIPLGASEQLQVMGRYSDGQDREVAATLALWSSSDETIATVGAATGLVTAQTGQTAGTSFTISATEQKSGEEFEASLTLQNAAAIFESIRIEPDTSESAWRLAEGGQYQFQAYAEYTDGSEEEITTDEAAGTTTETVWSLVDSSQSDVVTVDNRSGFKGLVTGVSTAEDQINTIAVAKENSRGNTIEQTATVVVGGPMLAAIEIKPAEVDLVNGDSQTLTANGIYTNNTEVDLTDEVEWSSPRLDVVQFNSVQPNLAEAVGVGTSLISATYPAQDGQSAFTGYRQINVEAKALRSMTVTPTTARYSDDAETQPLFLMGIPDQLTLTGTYSDSSTADLTSTVSWSSDDTSVVTISSDGLLTPVSIGTATITASQDITELGESKTISVQYSVEIGSALLQSIELEPQSPVVPVSTRKSFTAYGRYSDGSRADITQLVSWQTGYQAGADEATKIGVITNAVSGAGGGVFTAQFAGQIAVTASLDNFDGDTISASTMATTKAVTGLVLELDQTSLYKGQSATLTALGQLSDGTTAEFADGISWTLDTTSTLSIDTTSESSVLTINAIAAGNAQITASRTLLDSTVLTESWSITVQSPLLESIVVTLDVDEVPAGMTRQATATGHYSDDSTADITSSVDWSSSNTSRATIAADGVITGLTAGSLTVAASLDNAESETISSAAVTFTVQEKTLKAIAIAPDAPAVALGRQQQLTVSGTYSDDSLQSSVTSGITWQSSDTSVAIVDANGLVTTKALGTAEIEARIVGALTDASGDVDIYDTITLTVSAAQLNAISISDAPATLADGKTAQLSVLGTLSDGSSAGTLAASSVSWLTSNSSVASITAQGLLTARSEGQATIQISTTLDTGATVTDSVTLVVTAKELQSIAITADETSLAAGTQLQLVATGTYTDASITKPLQSGFIWQSSDTSVATVSASGKVTAQDVSTSTTVTITAAGTASGVTVTSLTLTVEPAVLQQLVIAGNGSSVPVGETQTFTVTGYDSLGDLMTSAEVGTVQWSTSDNTIATIDDSTGVLTAVNAGQVTVLASQLVGSTTVSAEIDVLIGDAELSSIEISAEDGSAAATVAVGMQHSFSATGVYSDGSEVSNLGTGFSWAVTIPSGSSATAVIAADGTLTVTGGSVGDTLVVTATPSSSSVTVTQTATVTLSAAELVRLTINENGVVVPVCQLATASCQSSGLTRQMTVTGLDSEGNSVSSPSGVSWSVSDTAIATIDSSSGELIGINSGTVTVTAQATIDSRQVVATATVLVGDAELTELEILSAANQSTITVGEGRQHQLTVTGSYSNSVEVADLSDVSWSVTPTTDATIDANGLLTALVGSSGSTLTVTASHADSGLSTTATVTVTDPEIVSLTLQEASSTLPINTTQTLTLAMLDSASQQCLATNIGSGTACSSANIAAVSWSSSDATIATVSQSGVVTAINYGTAEIYASLLAGPSWDRQLLTASATVVVDGKALVSIAISPASDSLAAGNQLQMSATGTYSDGSVSTGMSSGFVWQSADSATAYISPTGLVTASSVATDTDVDITVVPDDSTVTVTDATLTIQPAVLRQLFVSANGATVAIGASRTFTVTGLDTLGNAMTAAEVGTVAWSVSDTTLASIDSSTGVLSGIATGQVTVMASQLVDGVLVYGESEVLIGSAELTAIEVLSESNTATATVALGLQHQFSAKGTYSDGTTISDLTTGFSWGITNASGAAAGVVDANGLLTVTAGALSDTLDVTVTPSSTSVSVTAATVTVAAAELVSMTIEQQGSVVAVCLQGLSSCSTAGETLNMSVKGTNSDGTSVASGSITGVSWSVSDTSIATIDSATGELVGIATGSVTVTAETTVSGRQISASATVLVGSATLTSIEIQSGYGQSSIEVGLGMQHPLEVLGTYSNGVELDNLTGISWEITSASPQAYISSDGLLSVYGGTSGDTLDIQATHTASGKVATATVTLTDEEMVAINLTEAVTSLPVSTTTTLTLVMQDSLSQQCFATNAGTGTACTTAQMSGLSWSVSDTTIATIDSDGLITGVNEGTVDVTAQILVGPSWNRRLLTSSASVIVGSASLQSIALSSLTSLPAGTQQQMTVTGTYSNGVTQTLSNSDLDWDVTLPTGAAVEVTPTGLLQANQQPTTTTDTVTLTATWRADSSITATVDFTIDAEILAQMSIDEAGDQVGVGSTLQLNLSGKDSLGNAATVAMLTGASWSSSNSLIATVDSSTGLLTGIAEGTVTIYAVQDLGGSLGSVSTSAVMVVGEADVTAISIDSISQTAIAEGRQLQLAATATYSNGVQASINNGLSWAISDDTGGEVVASIDSNGLLTLGAESCTTATCQVSVTVTHSDSGQVSTALTLDVEAAELATLEIQQHGAVVAVGATETLTALGVDTLGNSGADTSSVVWSVSDSRIATIDQTGLLTGVATGTVTVTISQVVGTSTKPRTVVGSASLVIGAATVTDWVVTTSTGGASVYLDVGDELDFKVQANYSDGQSIGDVKADSGNNYNWSSNVVSGSPTVIIDSEGLVTVTGGSSGDQIEITVIPTTGTATAAVIIIN